MAWTQTDLDALKAAIAKGARSVTTSDGKSVTFHSLDEMLRLKAAIEAEVNGTSARPSSYSVVSLSKARR